jgi:acetyl esterase/lipase
MRQRPPVNVCFPFCIVAVLLLNQAAKADSQPKTLTYKVVGDLQIQADVYEPDESAPRPTIAWFHGGALMMGSRTGIPKQLIELSKRQGFLLTHHRPRSCRTMVLAM